MSSSTSSSSHSQRTPLHERSNSENNKLQIRLVPYTPPKIDAEEAGSRGSEPETPKSDAVFHSTRDRTNSSSTLFGRERFIGSALSSPSSSSSPVTTSTWVKGKGVSESRLVSDSSGIEHPAPPARAVTRTSHGSYIRHVNAPAQQSHGQHDNGAASSSTHRKPVPRRGSIININSDNKTFTLVKPSTGSESTVKSNSHSNTSAFSSHRETSFDAHTDDQPSSLFSSVAERSVSPPSPSTSATPTKLHEDHIASASPWNYRMIGGLRKVPKTPDPRTKGKGKEKEIVAERLPILSETTLTARVSSEPSSPLTLKPSFITENSDSNSDDATNFKIIGRSSPPLPDSDSIDVPSSSSSANYQLFGQSSGPQSFASSPARGQGGVLDTPGSKNFIVHGSPYAASEQAVLETPGSKNFVVHSNVSLSSSIYPLPRAPQSQTSFDSFGQESDGKYSQESLVIPPLRTHQRSSSENLHLNRTSRESVHGRSNSYSSISSILTQDTGPNVVRLAHTPSASSSLRQALWAGRSAAPPKSRMDVHQWSSQLSTVLSESEGSDRGSRMTSLGSFGGRGSRNIQSISSSLFDNLEVPPTHSRSGSLEQQGGVFMRGARELPTPPVRTVRDHDEHGDGLADLQHMHQLLSKSSRSRLGFLSRHSSDRSSRSTASSRTGSFSTNAIPTWARVYYGSGERRWLASSAMIAEVDDSPPQSSWSPGASPPPEQYVQDIYNPRRRPREAQDVGPQPFSPETAQPAAQPDIGDIRRKPKKMTSSIWSPHLRPDIRTSRYSLWQPPSETWSAENRVLGRRNIQLVLFVLGFIFPFAWMIAAFLPLPPKPQFDMEELDKRVAQSRKDSRKDSGAELLYRRAAPIDDSLYQSARWWRNLNRFMSIIGLLILGAIAALIVVGVKQRWGK